MTQKHGCDVYPHVVEKAQPLDVSRWQLSRWARWVAADDGGDVWEYKSQPVILAGNHIKRWWPGDGWAKAIGTIDITGIDWRRTLTPVNQAQPEPQATATDAQPWCARCNLPDDVCRGHEEITQPSPTVETIVRRWQQLDAMTECDLAAAMVRADVVRSDQFYALLGMALEAVRSPRYVGEDKERHARIWDSIEA